jgi:Ca-activated chloride channel family protein
MSPGAVVAVDYAAGERLWLLLLVAALAGGYVWLQFRRRQDAVRFANAELLASVAPRRPGWRRHLTAALLLGALAAMVVGFARPVRTEQVAEEQGTMMLAVDVSLSMMADDVEPNRLETAREAAIEFIDGLPQGVRLGLVRFARSAEVVVPPTDDKDRLRRAVAGLDLAPGTAIGEAIFACLDALESDGVIEDGNVLDDLDDLDDGGDAGDSGDGEDGERDGSEEAPGTRGDDEPPARIVVMSDGTTNSGRPDALAAEAAAAVGVPVSTIAFGTEDGLVENPQTGQFEPVPVDPVALALIADATGGTAYAADSLAGLEEVYGDIGATITTETVRRDLASWFAGIGLLLGGLAAAGSLVWSGRLP